MLTLSKFGVYLREIKTKLFRRNIMMTEKDDNMQPLGTADIERQAKEDGGVGLKKLHANICYE